MLSGHTDGMSLTECLFAGQWLQVPQVFQPGHSPNVTQAPIFNANQIATPPLIHTLPNNSAGSQALPFYLNPYLQQQSNAHKGGGFGGRAFNRNANQQRTTAPQSMVLPPAPSVGGLGEQMGPGGLFLYPADGSLHAFPIPGGSQVPPAHTGAGDEVNNVGDTSSELKKGKTGFSLTIKPSGFFPGHGALRSSIVSPAIQWLHFNHITCRICTRVLFR